MKLKSLVVAAVMALGSAGALAQFTNIYNIGTLPISPPSPPFSQAVTVPFGAFNDRWNFTFPLTGGSASASAVSLSLTDILGINGLQLQLFDSSNTLLRTGAQSGQSVTMNNVALTGGQNYYYVVSGAGTGSSGGAYTFIASASPVPEPETYALFLAGLAAVSFVARRRTPAAALQPA